MGIAILECIPDSVPNQLLLCCSLYSELYVFPTHFVVVVVVVLCRETVGSDGCCDGCNDGKSLGTSRMGIDGTSEGCLEGISLGSVVSASDGPKVGRIDGCDEGMTLDTCWFADGFVEGCNEGMSLSSLGCFDGALLINGVSIFDGRVDGEEDGSSLKILKGSFGCG